MKNITNMKNKGFTLIELLIVVLIISILAGLLVAVINPAGIRAKARDSQRKADLRKIQSALELYFAEYRAYPGSTGTGINAGSLPLTSGYMNAIPSSPNGPSYRYRAGTGSQEYVLAAETEVELDPADPNKCSNLNNTSIIPSLITAARCYGVENP
ncbi:MAG: hypothetical protein RLY61_889 [Candidatus Parcubacteria bacterium]|jgi:general secretion pathway protein G